MEMKQKKDSLFYILNTKLFKYYGIYENLDT